MNAMTQRHPVVLFVYYVMTLVLLIVAGHPLLYGLLLLLMGIDVSLNRGFLKMLKSFVGSLTVVALCVVVNPLLNHRGMTVLFYLNENAVTKEAVLYGCYMAVVLLGTIFLFSDFSHVMTSEKIMTMSGKRFPSFSLLFSMILRMVPKAKKDFSQMISLHGNRPHVWSALLGKTMEDSVERSMAMKAKSYGKNGRTSFYARKWNMGDYVFFAIVCMMGVFVIGKQIMAPAPVWFFPSIHMEFLPAWEILIWILYLGIPIWMYGKEEAAWLLSKRKITGFSTRMK